MVNSVTLIGTPILILSAVAFLVWYFKFRDQKRKIPLVCIDFDQRWIGIVEAPVKEGIAGVDQEPFTEQHVPLKGAQPYRSNQGLVYLVDATPDQGRPFDIKRRGEQEGDPYYESLPVTGKTLREAKQANSLSKLISELEGPWALLREFQPVIMLLILFLVIVLLLMTGRSYGVI